MASNGEAKSGGFSFGFSKVKKASNVVATSNAKFDPKNEAKEEVDYVKEVNDKEGVKGSIVKEAKKELVIPCQGNTI